MEDLQLVLQIQKLPQDGSIEREESYREYFLHYIYLLVKLLGKSCTYLYANIIMNRLFWLLSGIGRKELNKLKGYNRKSSGNFQL